MAATIDVNPANQAFPAPGGGSQALPIPSFVQVPNVPFIQPSFVLGTSDVDGTEVEVENQNAVRFPVEEWLVTENGNIQTNNTNGDIESFIIQSVAVLTDPDRYKITFTTSTLGDLGLSLVGMNAFFPSAAAASSPENVPSRVITSFSGNFIIVEITNPVSGTDLTTPIAGQTVRIAVVRDGTSPINDIFGNETDVIINPAPQVASTTVAQTTRSVGTVQANDGVVSAFVNSGVRGVPFIGTFEVENQVYGTGLPANVFV